MALSDLLGRSGPTLQPPGLPSLNPLVSATDRIMSRWPDAVADPPEQDRERLVQTVLERLQRHDWRGTRLSLVTAAARALFDTERQARPDLEELREFYYRETAISDRSTFLNAMVSVYLSTYAPDAAHTRALAQSLAMSVDRLGGRWCKLLSSLPDFFDPGRAHLLVAQKMLEMEEPYGDLKKLGLQTPHSPGIMDHAHIAYIDALAPSLATQDSVDKLLKWLRPEGLEPRETGAPHAIEALLRPWTSKQPPESFQGYLVEKLVSLYGDPRVQRGNPWSSVPDDLMLIMMRWLTGENIRFFLDVVTEVEESHMWEPRRKFWLGLYEQGRIDAAWVAFSEEGARVARRRQRTLDGRPGLSFGNQVAGGSRLHTSLLILQIGRKIVVEGSHSYKVHIFDAGTSDTPRLYERRYDCERIRRIRGAAARPHLGDWQGWVLERV